MRKTWKLSSPIPKVVFVEIKRIAHNIAPNELTIILHWNKQQIPEPFKAVNCVVCGKPIPDKKGWQVGYMYTASGRSTTRTPSLFDSFACVNKWLEDYQTPLFENLKAKELFQKEHPTLWKRITKKTLVLSEVKKE